MRTEEDLRNAFDHLADSAPDPARILTAPEHTPVRRRRTPLALGVVAATAAVAIAVPTLISHDKQPPVQAAPRPADEAWQDRLSLPLSANLIYDSRAFGHRSQGLILDGGNTRTTCVVNTYAKGVFDARTIPAGSPRVKINSTLGYVAALADPLSPAVKAKVVAWEPAPGTWTTSYCKVKGEVDPAKATEIARLVNTSPQRLPAPYRVGYLPAGLTVTSLSVNPQGDSTSEPPNNFIAAIGSAEDQTSVPQNPDGPVMVSAGGPVQIAYFTGSAAATRLPKDAERISINGRTGYLGSDGRATVLVINGDGFQVRIELGGTVPNERAELIKIANGLELAPSATDTSSWFDATTAIP
ncbi:hypothetical protein EV138_0524 [Kribbella voronezhensis]|uniref:DUF4367 domain-containing protein n=1 Tax=Kribbella voronezhensis TaxID=2512212 RepID=A0A4R7T7C0_9ACTN|nr:hypothetical protein [Kribbella voronezhensis]TDU87007.1 hypothetical protein EV138_0524 [Kribbella voronezhensis]